MTLQENFANWPGSTGSDFFNFIYKSIFLTNSSKLIPISFKVVVLPLFAITEARIRGAKRWGSFLFRLNFTRKFRGRGSILQCFFVM